MITLLASPETPLAEVSKRRQSAGIFQRRLLFSFILRRVDICLFLEKRSHQEEVEEKNHWSYIFNNFLVSASLNNNVPLSLGDQPMGDKYSFHQPHFPSRQFRGLSATTTPEFVSKHIFLPLKWLLTFA
jgi:hypothetical protein